MTIPNSIQEFVRQRANFQCEYCHYSKFLSTSPLTIDRIMPQSLEGSDNMDNLALACRRCKVVGIPQNKTHVRVELRGVESLVSEKKLMANTIESNTPECVSLHYRGCLN